MSDAGLSGIPEVQDPSPQQGVKPESGSPEQQEDNEPEPVVPSLDPASVFAQESSQSMDDDAETRPTHAHIRELMDKQDVNLQEAGVAQALKILDSLRGTFSRYDTSEDAKAWINAIDKLKLQAERKRTVVGVVGNTGAGKSSVINAMLDEERLVPTNCMRACTAVVTELSWNNNNDPNAKYRAEIEFISPADWEKELGVLLKEFLTEDGNISRETSDPNSDAGIAWAKFHAVYPKKTEEMLAEANVTELMTDRSVVNILGTTKRINESRPEPFYSQLQRYVDSKEKATGKKDKKKEASQMEYWPLIKVVKIYTKSPALSTGAVIVDLPGVHDSNAARAAVAQGYMKQCTGLWIVAPINRAVDDKAAKSLLGDSFKRQLKYDGGFSNVTFICSKTDDISITEATDSLGLEDQVSGLEQEARKQQKAIKDLQDKILELKELQAVYNQAYDDADDDIEEWEKLKDGLNEGKPVYAPAKNGAKRKRKASSQTSRKRRRDQDDSDNDFVVSDNEASESDAESGSDSDEEVQAPQEPLTEDQIEAKLEELKDTKKNARRQKNELEAQIKDIRPEIREAKEKLAAVRAEMSAICIAGRNEYSKGAIQVDFAAGIKELDQEAAAEEDEENFNPEEDMRDYEQVAKSLPVFCVSSRAYQKMSGRLKKDEAVPGFKTLDETEIPQLQAHCKKLTEAGRIQAFRAFFLSFLQLLNTFSFWASDDGSGLKLTDDEKKAQVKYINWRLSELEKGLEKAVETCIKRVKKEMEDQIFQKYPELIKEAIQQAPITSAKWGAHKNDGGLYWATYKATVRRDGVYSGASGPRDFNAELIEPITKKLATGWERTFQNRLPKAFEVYVKDSNAILRRFHETVEDRARQNGVGLATLSMLKAQIYTNEELFSALYQVLITAMVELQRDANRDFTPVIVQVMYNAYKICTEEHGKGSFARMKAAMAAHVDQARHHMFTDALQTVQTHLNHMCRELQKMMEDKADEIYVSMRHDYLKALGGVQVNQAQVMSREDRAMRAEIKPLLLSVDEKFKAVLDGTIEDETDVKSEGGPQAVPDAAEEMDVDRQEIVNVQDEEQQFHSASEGGQGAAPSSARPDTDQTATVKSEGNVDFLEGVNQETAPPPQPEVSNRMGNFSEEEEL